MELISLLISDMKSSITVVLDFFKKNWGKKKQNKDIKGRTNIIHFEFKIMQTNLCTYIGLVKRLCTCSSVACAPKQPLHDKVSSKQYLEE